MSTIKHYYYFLGQMMINVENELISYELDDLLSDFDGSVDLGFYQDSVVIESDENLIESIVDDYFTNRDLSDELVQKIKYDFDFKVILLQNIQDRMKRIINDSSTLMFKELVTVINLLSLGKRYTIFERYNEFSTDEISKLFREYEAFLQELFASEDSKNYELTFNYYLTLIEAYNELCILNSTDVKRKKSIAQIIELVTESINMLKFTVRLDEKKIGMLGNLQGKFLFFYSHVLYISTKDKTIDDLIYEYKFTLEKQLDGYFLASSHLEKEETNYYLTLLSNSTYLLLVMLLKFEEYEESVEFEKVKPIIEIFKRECKLHFEVEPIETIEDFKAALLNNFVYVYHHDLKISYHDLIAEIIAKKDFSSSNMQLIHNIVLFSDFITKDEMLSILNEVLNIEKFANDYHEYYKLKLIDILINKMIKINEHEALCDYISKIIHYIEEANTASHLMSVFSKIFLSLSYLFSLMGPDLITRSQKMYFIGEKICSFTLIKDEYQDIYKDILYENAKAYKKVFKLENPLNKRELIDIAQYEMLNFFQHEEIKIKHELSSEISQIIQTILIHNEIEKEELEIRIAEMISKKIFFGLSECIISKEEPKHIDNLYEIGYEVHSESLTEGYSIYYKYPFSYEGSFKSILELNNEYIRNNLTNMILSYLVRKNVDSHFSKYLNMDDVI